MSRRGDSQQRRWSAWGWGLFVLLSALSFSACIEDVAIPQCLFDSSCPEAGAGGDGEGPSISAGSGKGGDLGVPGGGTEAGGAAGELAMAGQGGQAGEADTCPTCTISPEHLTPACAGKPYQANLFVGGGIAPHSWQLDPQPAGWSIGRSSSDSNVAVLHADAAPLEDTELTLVVTDARGYQRTFALPLQVRTTCWFAYTSLSEAGPKLQLVDPLAKDPSPTPLDHAVGTYDFQFSPDGAFLAYRYGADEEHPRGRHLSLLDLTNLKEHPLLFDEDSVVSYAWAPTSTVLAVAYEKDGQTRLGGVRAPAPGSEASPPPLVSTSATIESDLYWVADQFVVFHAPAAVGTRRDPYYSQLGSAGFATPQGINRSFPPGVAVQPTDTGFYLISPGDTVYSDLTDALLSSTEHLKIALVAPSGRYTADLEASGLPQLFPAEIGRTDMIIEPEDGTGTCSQLLAWAADRERFACVADVSNNDGSRHGEIRIFDLNDEFERLDASTLEGFCPGDVNDTSTDSCLFKREGYSFSRDQAAGSGRAMSPSGRYLAFGRTASGYLYIYLADLDSNPMRLASPRIFNVHGINPSPLAFEFSPDEQFLSARQGPLLLLIKPATGEWTWLDSNLADAAPCSEDFPAGPEAYCGNSRPGSAPVWSSDSRATAFRTSEALTIIDLSLFPRKDDKVLPAPACAGQCSGQIAFQP
jgi:hypothetical protein